MSVKKLKHGISMMKWNRRHNGDTAWILAKSVTLRGHIILMLRGYSMHNTLFGWVMRKDILTNTGIQ